MRLTKMLGLASVAAVAAMAFLGASSAMASETIPTALCYEESAELECPTLQQVHLESFLAKTTTLVTSLATVLCLHSVAIAEAEEKLLAKAGETLNFLLEPKSEKLPQGGLTFEECGLASGGEAHNNCEVTVNQLPLLQILKTAADLGTATINPLLAAKVHVKCGSTIDCEYSEPVENKPFSIESSGHTVGAGNGMLSANELEVKKLAGGLFCPKVSKWTALYEPLKPIWIRS
jgi:hypothetical protein